MLKVSSRKIQEVVASALNEDAAQNDVTTRSLVPASHASKAVIVLKEDAVICGVDIAREVFKKLDGGVKIVASCKDGDRLKKNSQILRVDGKTRAILTAERTALNFLGYLSGVATNTRNYVDQIKDFKAKVLDTRKTTPTLRVLEKYAVRCGGGENHRPDLASMILVKDNHLAAVSGMTFKEIVARCRHAKKQVEIEVDHLKQLQDVLLEKPDMILLDNMNVSDLKRAVSMCRMMKGKRPLLEASGGITLKNIKSVAATGVDRISVGALTHQIRFMDVSMEIKY
jgi:nicotinate-nucleotide pyrophosphorylase (carboxylating)